MAARQRRFYRLLQLQDIPELEVASAHLFAFGNDLRLADIVQDDRWFCLAAVASPSPGVERIVGFVAAAVGAVSEFSQEAVYLQQALLRSQPVSSSSGDVGATVADLPLTPAAAASASALGGADTVLEITPVSTSNYGSISISAATANAAAAAASAQIAVEVVLLGVVSDARRQGVASRLLQQVKRHARSQGASLLFLHVQDTNMPARQLYRQAGFEQVAVLANYYSRQLQGQGPHAGAADTAAAAAAGAAGGGVDSSSGSSSSPGGFRGGVRALLTSDADASTDSLLEVQVAAAPTTAATTPSSRPSAFSGVDAQLLVLLLRQPAVLNGAEPDAAGATVPSSAGAGGAGAGRQAAKAAAAFAGSSTSSSSSSTRAVDMSAFPPLRLPHSSSSSDSSSSSETGPPTPASSPQSAAEAAAGAAAEAAAAAAGVVLGGALRILTGGLFGRDTGNSTAPLPLGARLGRLVDLGGELMVEVRQGRDVVLVDPDELPADVVLSAADKERLRQRRRWEGCVRDAQQQQQRARDEDGDAGSSGSSSGSGGSSMSAGGGSSGGSGASSSAAVGDLASSSSSGSSGSRVVSQQEAPQHQQQQQWGLPACPGVLSTASQPHTLRQQQQRLRRLSCQQHDVVTLGLPAATGRRQQQQQLPRLCRPVTVAAARIGAGGGGCVRACVRL